MSSEPRTERSGVSGNSDRLLAALRAQLECTAKITMDKTGGKMTPKTFIALLRGINVSGRNKIPMSELRSLCADLGWQDVQSYIQSGNLVFKAESTAAKLETALEQAIERQFGLSIALVVRAAAVWPSYVRDNPFPEASQSEHHLVMLALSKATPKPDAVEKLQERATAGERIVQVNDALWIHFAGGVAKSKLSPALFDRLVGSPVTSRNWRTVLKLHEMVNPFIRPAREE